MIEFNQSQNELNKTQIMLIENTIFDCLDYCCEYLSELPVSKNFIYVFLSEFLFRKNQTDFKLFKSDYCNSCSLLKEHSAENFWNNTSRMVDYVNGLDNELTKFASSNQLHSQGDVDCVRKNVINYAKLYSKNLVVSKMNYCQSSSIIEKEKKVILAREKMHKREEKLLDRQEKILEERMKYLSIKVDKSTQTEFEDKKPANLVDKFSQVNLNLGSRNRGYNSN